LTLLVRNGEKRLLFNVNEQDVEDTLTQIAWERHLNNIVQNLNFKSLVKQPIAI